ncbi:hypothetical protein TTHERM_00787040 (macronuclear) [Tetrahymena thermophila SB210]|uniref:Uncharacterized protein n=1 Tax=Tetrahymena thermophila (strain SB210) TaxID=312017 RepID=Q23ZF9_TETTS|nr:hypothetical protein TTHERM_00787040 [Tetrahymena thermophila SB210]EAS01898.1 hypothetical protein TTHERM_00787040 [Tetrahymena thermophila SB210]|eukprot:XP_001022143.1 hypothetical protein TTHERM_00787040 [Tetrahymena thermophila SB210]
MDSFSSKRSINAMIQTSSSQDSNIQTTNTSKSLISDAQDQNYFQICELGTNQLVQNQIMVLSNQEEGNLLNPKTPVEKRIKRKQQEKKDDKKKVIKEDDKNVIDIIKNELKSKSQSLQNFNNINRKTSVNKKLKYSEYLINKYLNSQSLFVEDKKFYIFSEVILDINYFKNFSQKEQYVHETKLQQYQKGFRFVNKVTHRIDNKFIEIDSQYFPQKLSDIKGILYMLNSLGDQSIQQFIQDLQQFWDTVISFQLLLKEEYKNSLFQKHFKEREEFCDKKCQEILQQLDPQQLVMYVNHYPDYEKYQLQSRLVGYSPELYELVAINSYIFYDYLSKNGCCDPRAMFHNFGNTLQEAIQYLYAIQLGLLPDQLQIVQNTELVTFDGFAFPVKQTTDVYLLAREYDIQHGLNFKSQQILVIQNFEFLDENAKKTFKMMRQEQQQEFQASSLEKVEQKILNFNKNPQQIELINKYYADSLSDLYQFGNKWLKRCGFVDIKKKNKQEED